MQRLAQPLPVPGPLRTPARPAQPLEPILVPKLRIEFADFPYLHCSIARGCSPWRPAADMGTVGHENRTVSPGFSRADRSAPDTAGSAVLYGYNVHISGQADSMESDPYKEKRTLPGTPADVTWFACVTALDSHEESQSPWPGSGILTRFPFDRVREIFNQRIQSVPRFGTEFSYLLGPTDPCSTAVHMEPFSTSAFKVLV